MVGYLGGLAAFGLTLAVDPLVGGLSVEAWRTLGLAMLMAVWWITECVPLPVTSFLPIVLGPVVAVAPLKEVTASYGHPLIFLFLGGFALSLAVEKVGLHQRIARAVVASAGPSPRRQIGGLMLVTAGLSMWISNTATAVIMLPIALSMLRRSGGNRRYGNALLLGVAYAASIGGLATLVGTPPNALLAAYLEKTYGIHIGFGQWMLFGVPFSLALLAVAWMYLALGHGKMAGLEEATAGVRAELEGMGRMGRGERWVALVFGVTAVAWMLRSQLAAASGLAISDTEIAMAAALALFLLPSGAALGPRILDWSDMQRLPWGILLLFGGGLALATMMERSGLAEAVGRSFENLDTVPTLMAVAAVSCAILFLTEITSNTATAASLLPLVGPVAVAFGESPTLFAIPAAVAASCAFMLPVATPPNAIVFGSGELRVSEMAKAGLGLNLAAVVLLTLAAAWVLPVVF